MSKENTVLECFNHPEFLKKYSKGVRIYSSGYDLMHRLVIQLLSEKLPYEGHVVVLGAGGGQELMSMCEARQTWRFTAIDPANAMLDQAKTALGEDAGRVEWIYGKIEDAPNGPYDAATCLLTLHAIPDDGSKLSVVKELRKRMKSGSPLLVVDSIVGATPEQKEMDSKRYIQFAVDSGIPRKEAEETRKMMEANSYTISLQREEELFQEGGFHRLQLFFAALSWTGWIMYA